MKSLLRALAGAVIAASATFASAQPVTLDFEDFAAGVNPADSSTWSGYVNTYKNFDFSNATGTAGTWAWYTSASPFAGSPSPLINISGSVDPLPVPNDSLEAFVFKHAAGTPFTLQSMWVCCGPVYLELLDTTGGIHFAGGFNGGGVDNDAFGNPQQGIMTNPLTGQAIAGVYEVEPPLLQNLQLSEVAIWSFPGTFAVDDIKVTVVPEPSSYLMMAVGLGALLVVRRRKNANTGV